MKRKGLLFLSLAAALAAVMLFAGCGKKDETAGPQLLEALNKNFLGIRYEVDSDNISAEKSGGGFNVVFKDATVIMDTGIFKETSLGENIKSEKVPVKMDAITFFYKPKEKHLECTSVKGMHLNWDLAELVKIPQDSLKTEVPEMDFDFRAGAMEFTNYDISPIISYEGDNFWEFAKLLLEKNQSVESAMKDFAYRVNMSDIGEDGGKLDMDISIAEMTIDQKSMSGFFVNLYKKDAEIPDMNELLKNGDPLFDVSSSMKDLKFSYDMVEEGEKKKGSGSLADASMSYYLKPNEDKTHFDMAFDYDLGRISMDVPGKDSEEALQIIEGIKSMNMNFALRHLSPQLVKSYMEMTRNSMAMQNDPEKMKEMASGTGQQLLGQLMQSQPVLQLGITPLVHEMGKMDLSAEFSMPQAMVPDGKAVLRIYNLNEVLASIKDMKGFSEEDFKAFSQWANMMLQVDEDGNGVLTFEMKKEEPGVRYLNGMRM